ncbi:hypothetical protein [Sebaldella sp. S0638]|uniref:hypothetical protein n=1 Tax=Sebaldella sp. S0638 TaxID=2957809 RepID=UPI00209D2218|nr:hypothetical protein [Sebaldella sp. S0638]MCP1224518.1 hypothetical protein [Sebaldella sp. S0638]
MFRNKKLLMFLALNSLAGATAVGSSNEFNKYENMYNKMTKNLDKNISNSSNYKLLEKVLNQRNRELKDLYLQSDYIVKPEYLEWQIFFSGFYNVKDRKGEKEVNEIPTPSTSGTIDVSISMPNVVIDNSNININGVSVKSPAVNINKNTTAIPEVSYSNNITIPEFVIPELPVVIIDQPTVSVSAASLFSSSSMYDKTFYNPGLTSVQTWNGGLFSNYNLESGDYTFNRNITNSVNSASFSFDNAVGSIDPTALADATLNQPAVIPTSDSNSINSMAAMMVVSTSSPSIRIGSAVNINYTSYDNTTGSHQYAPIMLQYPLNSNRSALNADADYAFGGSMAYPDSAANVPFSILRNSGTITISGNYIVAGMLMNKNNQTGNRNDYLLVNDGTIIGEYADSRNKEQIGFAFQGSATLGTKGERLIMGNDGVMEFRAPSSTGFHIGGVNLGKYLTAYNRGSIDMYGSNSLGIKMVYSSLSGYTPGSDQTNSKILLEKPINIHGDNSIGVYYTPTNMKAENSIFKVTIGTEKNSYTGNISNNDPNYVENSIGLYIYTRPNGSAGTSTAIFRDYDIKFGDYAKNSVLFLNDSNNSYNMTSKTFSSTSTLLETYMDNSVVSSIDADSGSNNVVFYNKGNMSNGTYASVPILYIKPDINVGTANKPVNNTLALYNYGGIAHLTGNIETYGEYSHGLYNDSINKTFSKVLYTLGSKLDNTIDGAAKSISVITHGDNSAAIYNRESEINFLEGGTYKALGEGSVVLYNKDGNINITGDATFEVSNKGTLIMANGGSINLNGSNTYNVKNNSVFAYALGTAGIKVNFSGANQTLNLSGGSIGFVYDGDSSKMQQDTLYNYLNANFAGLNNLNVNVLDDARLFVLNNYGTLKLSELENLDTGAGLFGSISGNGGNTLLNKGTLVLDGTGTINLDDPDDFYANTDKAATGITVESGIVITGTQDNQIALGGKDTYRGTPGGNTYVVMENNGTINLSGDKSVGIYTNNGIINNVSNVSVTGKNSAGLFGENSSVITNNGNINIADSGVGIYAVSYQNPAEPDAGYGNGLVDVTNNGIITANTSEKATGIYVNNNKTGAVRSTGTLNLSNGTVDMSLSNGSTGVYADNATVSGGGTISVGESGTGLYAKNSDLNISNMTLNMNKNNSVGVYLDSGSNMNATGTNTVNIKGERNTVFGVSMKKWTQKS